jgi:hypothetical protein
MIIWSGLGILIPLLAVGGFIAGFIIATAIGQPAWGGGLGLLIAAVLNWLLWKMVYPKVPKILVDPTTGQQHIITPRHSLFFIPARAWTWILGFLAVPAILLGVAAERSNAQEAQKPGFKEFNAANDLIDSKKSGVAHGNHEAAKECAAGFSSSMKMMTEALFTGGSKANLMTGGDFLTYCHESEDTVAFLCHVPSLRSYKTKESKTALQEIAWACAQKEIEKRNPNEKKKIVIGLRGTASYGSMQEGMVADEDGAVVSSPDQSLFFPAFATTKTE